MDNLSPRSDALAKELEKTLNQYNEGAITSPELCIHVLVALANWEKEICDENDAVRKHFDEIATDKG